MAGSCRHPTSPLTLRYLVGGSWLRSRSQWAGTADRARWEKGWTPLSSPWPGWRLNSRQSVTSAAGYGVSDYHDRAGCVVDAMLAGRTEEGLNEPAMTPAAHHQQVSSR